jgi:hypothetical protein
MPDIRTNLTVDLHRELKGEAVRKDMPLKELIVSILEEHVIKNGGSGVIDSRTKQGVRV